MSSTVKLPHDGQTVDFRGIRIRYVMPEQVRPGDRLCVWLSDGSAYPTVTGFSDRLLRLSRYGLEDVTHRTWQVTGDVPWWVDDNDVSADVTRPVPIRAEEV